jgi:transcriptional regulator GlxA family with amidase domain
MKIQILVFDGFDELDAIAPYEVLRMVRAGDWDVSLISAEGLTTVTGNNGLVLSLPSKPAAFGLAPDLLIVPGGGWVDKTATGASREVERGIVPTLLEEQYRRGTVIASVCTGAMLLSAAGLLKGRPAITHHSAIEDLRKQGALITDARVVDDGDIITAGGITSGIDLALWIIERFRGKETADKITAQLEYTRTGTIRKPSS